MNFQTLQLAHESGIATITLSRPEKRNAISFQLVDELSLRSTKLKLRIPGRDHHRRCKAFCAGMDSTNLKACSAKLTKKT